MTIPRLSGLSGNEIYCMHLKGYRASGHFIGNSIQSLGYIGNLASSLRGVLGGEVPQITESIHNGREAALKRMIDEAVKEGAHGIVGVSSALRSMEGNAEFLAVGSGVIGNSSSNHFSSSGDAQELFCHIDAGYQPKRFVFGNIAYSVGAGRSITGTLKTMVRGEIKEYSDVFNKTRHHALERLVTQARSAGANSVVGVKTVTSDYGGVNEMYMTGTATHNPSLPAEYNSNPVTSDLTGEELWSMTRMGYIPLKLLISTSVYSLGVIGGLKAAFKGLAKGEITNLTTLVYEARENVFNRIRAEGEELGADEVVGIQTYIFELGSGLIELMAIGTAVRKSDKVKTASDQLPAQAIIRDRDTWL